MKLLAMGSVHVLRHLSVSLFMVSILSLSSSSSAEQIDGNYLAFGINRESYSKPAHINIGAIMLMTQGYADSSCSNKLYPGSWCIEYSEAVAFAVEKVNKNTTLLPNITLGFHLLDDCTDRKVALAQALSFLPREELSCTANACSRKLSNFSTPPEAIPHYDVIGILAPILSISAVPVSYLMASARLPVVGFTTTSDDLGDKELHPYFLRVVTSDRYQAIAMLEFIKAQGWSYISVIYSEGSYGERAYDVIKSKTPSYDICIATSHRVALTEDMSKIADDLLKNENARVVILFADEVPALNLFASIESLNSTGKFIWICCDSVTVASKEKLRQHRESVVGAFMFTYFSRQVPEFYEYIRKQDFKTSKNPWFKLSWESTMDCEGAACDSSRDITTSPNFGFNTPPSLAMDAVFTFAHGAHDLISTECPGVKGEDARKCIKENDLLGYLRNVTFEGYTGQIRFDQNNDFKGRYIITQMDYVYAQNDQFNDSLKKDLIGRTVAYFDTAANALQYTNESLKWDHLLPSTNQIPESVCSQPCAADEYKIIRDPTCCWDCGKCRDNEKIDQILWRCVPCEQFTWPDSTTNFTTCSPIALTFTTSSDTLSVILIFIGTLGIILTMLMIGAYLYYRETPIIKAASRELSFFQLGGIFAGYLTVCFFQSSPTPNLCSALYFMFCLSFAWLYSPLLIKAIRIYRIFQSGSKNNRRPMFISPISQVLMASMLILSQVILCLVMYILYYPSAKTTQPVLTDKFVELACDMTLPGLASFLIYNIILVSLCSVFAFKTRKLPDNFNESKFISMCVYTTLIIWLAFIPSYFTGNREFVRSLLLSVALLLNHSVAMLFLFLPKIYACVLVPPEQLITKRVQTGGTGVSQNHFDSSNRVAPDPVTETENSQRH